MTTTNPSSHDSAARDASASGNQPPAPQNDVLRVLRIDRSVPLPSRTHPSDAGLHLSAAEDVVLSPGCRKLVRTGIAVGIPGGYVGLLHPRSGLASRVGLSMVNAPGTIDAGYTGEIMVNLINLDRREDITIRRGDRIAQLIVQHVVLWDPVEVDSLAETQRADRGHGSTGGHSSLR